MATAEATCICDICKARGTQLSSLYSAVVMHAFVTTRSESGMVR